LGEFFSQFFVVRFLVNTSSLYFSLDIRNLIDFNIIATQNVKFVKNENEVREIYTVNEVNHAIDTIHCFLVCLGDLHRYFIEFNFPEKSVDQKITSKFYMEAFKLNPKIGMPQNQLGTLLSGKNQDIDSIRHYLQSLSCQLPFELSENNVVRIFQANTNYIENSLDFGGNFNVRNFLAQMILVIDIFYFDKEVNDFNSLCHAVLIEFKQFLSRWKFSKDPMENLDIIFNLTAIFMFCLLKLKIKNSPKVHNLNAFLVAFCSEIVDCCITRIDNFIADHKEENLQFCDSYFRKFQEFDQKIKVARDFYRKNCGTEKSGSSGKEGRESGRDSLVEPQILKKYEFVEDSGRSQEDWTAKGQDTKIQDFQTKIQEFQVNGPKIWDQDFKEPKKIQVVQEIRRGSNGFQENQGNSAGSSSKSGKHPDDYQKSTLDSQDDPKKSMESMQEEKSCSTKGEKKKMFRRRRKKPILESDVESESDYSGDESDDSLDTDFDSFDDDSDFSSDESEEEEPEIKKKEKLVSDNDDIIVENETIVYNNDSNQILSNLMKLSNSMALNLFQGSESDNEDCKGQKTSSNEDFIIEDEKIMLRTDEKSDVNIETVLKMKYKKRYTKVNPNLVLEFQRDNEDLIKSLKILFDWLRVNQDILLGCNASNPEFIQKIMKLMNFINIDIFTRKIYFDRSMISLENVRSDLRYIFDQRHRIPVQEDIELKRFVLFEELQSYLEWDLNYKWNISKEEDVILRNFKLIDFGFYLCKMKMGFNFCARSRVFIEKRRRGRKRGERRGGRRRREGRRRRDYGERGSRERGSRRHRSKDGNSRRSRDRNSRRSRERNGRRNDSREPKMEAEQKKPRKGYLKSKKESREAAGKLDKENTADNKNELMGKLWLRNEVQNLESKSNHISLTPYLILDSKSLTSYLNIVKNLVKTKKFVVLIPTAVLSDLDELKKNSEGARNAIKWMESEFKRGNRYMRSQRNNESMTLPYLKVPKKLGEFFYYLNSQNL
jgi:protein SMG5